MHWICFLSCVFQCFSWKGKGANGWFLTRRAHKHTGVDLRAGNGMLWSKRCVTRGEFLVEVQSIKGPLVSFSKNCVKGVNLSVNTALKLRCSAENLFSSGIYNQ